MTSITNRTMMGRELKASRAFAGLTQRQAAERLGIHWNTLIDIERGRVQLSGDEFLRIREAYRTVSEDQAEVA